MKIVWLSWKDHTHPAQGGAEVVKQEIARRMARDGHELVVITSRYKGSNGEEQYDGYTIVRRGNKFTTYLAAAQYYRKHLKDWADVVIDECNTVPYFAKFYAKKPVVMFFHQLAREIWFHELPKPIGVVGYFLEPLYLKLLSSLPAITVSRSTRADLIAHGFNKRKLAVIPEAITLKPITRLSQAVKAKQPTLIIHGAVRSMKQTHHGLLAFEVAKKDIPGLRLIISGRLIGKYGQKVSKLAASSQYAADIEVLGHVSANDKLQLMRKAHFIIVTSVKEGWGLIVTEAASQGTPAIVYNTDGLRDAIGKGRYGYLSDPSPTALAKQMVRAFAKKAHYKQLQKEAYYFAKSLDFEITYEKFMKYLGVVSKK